MSCSNLEDVLKVALAGFGDMLAGKTFLHIIRALRMITEELISLLFSNKDKSDFDFLTIYLKNISSKSRTSKHRIDFLIKPIFIMLMLRPNAKVTGLCICGQFDKHSVVCIIVNYSITFKVKENFSLPIIYLFYPSQNVFYVELVSYSDSQYKILIESIIKY